MVTESHDDGEGVLLRRIRKIAPDLPVAVALVVSAILWLLGARHAMALATWGLSTFVLVIIGVEFWKGTKARAHIEGEGYPAALYHLITRNRRRWGGYIVHAGMVMIFIGFAGSAYNVDVRKHMVPGDVVEVQSPFGHTYSLTYEGLSPSIGRGQRNLEWQAIALLSVSREGKSLGTLTTEKRQYRNNEQTMTEVGIRSTAYEDLYLILAAVDDLSGALNADVDAQGVDLQVLVKPLIALLWWGGLVLIIGSLIGLWPSAERRKVEVEAPAAQEPEPVGAA
jgi:cytochrome c-type biogenesis protein CcmF